jgi:phosphoribosylformylglycinamidine synthase
MWQIAESIKGLGEAARAFSIPVISGNVSLYNQTNSEGIQPTPLLALVGLIDDCNQSAPSQFQNDGDTVLLIGRTNEGEIGGSAYLAEVHGVERGALPALDYELEQKTCAAVRELINHGFLRSCHDLSQGGLGAALAESCFRDYQRPLGVTLTPAATPSRPDCFLFSESGARFLVSCAPETAEKVKEICRQNGLNISAEGVVGGDMISVKGVAAINSKTAFDSWFGGLTQLFEA